MGKMRKHVYKLLLILSVLFGGLSLQAGEYFVGPGMDQDGNLTGNWVVYYEDDGGRVTTRKVFKSKKKAEEKAEELNEGEG